MEKERKNALEVGKEEKKKIKESTEEKSRRAIIAFESWRAIKQRDYFYWNKALALDKGISA